MKSFNSPSLENIDINSLPTRSAMGLPNSFVSNNYSSALSNFDDYRTFKKNRLVSILESHESKLYERICAGTVLALTSDPRIKTLSPQMQAIEGGSLEVGTSAEKIELLYEEYKELGVKKEWLQKEYPIHTRDVTSFNLARFPVTNIEYLDYLKDTGSSEIPCSWKFGQFPSARSNHPVYSISYSAVLEYIAWLNYKTKKKYRLPTESEWECAATGKDKKEFPWGENFDDELANTLESNILSTTSVGCFPRGASDFGNLDMSGNVEEYTSTSYTSYPNGQKINDDLLLSLKEYKVAKGGSFLRFRDLARISRRHGAYPGELYAMGFRLAHD